MGFCVRVLVVVSLVACGSKSGGNMMDANNDPVCGNGIVEGDEQCDDATAGCTAQCTFACTNAATDCPTPAACQLAQCTAEHTCASVADTSKENALCGNGMLCRGGACVSINCGNSIVEPGEDCDFGAANGANTGCEADCHYSCSGTSCDDNEACNGVETCVPITVGSSNGFKCMAGTAEQNATPCGTNQICINAVCTAAQCGDSYVTGTEECDDGNATAGDGCETNCMWTCLGSDPTRDCTPADACAGQGTCGTNHTCSAGTALPDNTACGTGGYCKMGVCTQPVCGNGTLEPGEVCDDGMANGTPLSGCKANCTYVCVNAATDCGTAPACDKWQCTATHMCQAIADTSLNGMSCGGSNVCNNGSCSAPGAVCGNGVTETGEDCDFGSGNGAGTGCETNCKFSCTKSPNSCDDGNACNGAETCNTVTVMNKTGQKCAAGSPLTNGTSCGTGKICLSQSCVTSACGDGYLDMARGETCEPPNTASCDTMCHLIVCGDGVRAGSEQCDDGNTTNLDGCHSDCSFEQSHRMTSLALQFSTDTYCTKNRLGAGPTNVGTSSQPSAQKMITDAVNSGVSDGSITIGFQALGLADLTGTSGTLQMGVLGGVPVAGTGYSGNSDLDWWYTTDAATIDASRVPVKKAPASITAKALTAGPANFAISVNFVGVPVTMDMLNVKFKATVGASSTPLASTGTTPGHLASEHLDPALQSFATMTAGEMCGDTTAQSLANILVPSVLVGPNICSQNYTSSNTMLDVYISGCTYLGFIAIVNSQTQPDGTRDGNNNSLYKFFANAQHFVTSCTRGGQPANLTTDCLPNATYSSFYKFTTDRVIFK